MKSSASAPRLPIDSAGSPRSVTAAEPKEISSPRASTLPPDTSPRRGLQRNSRIEHALLSRCVRGDATAVATASSEKEPAISPRSAAGNKQDTLDWLNQEDSDNDDERRATAAFPAADLTGPNFSLSHRHHNALRESQDQLVRDAMTYFDLFRGTASGAERPVPASLAPNATPMAVITAVLTDSAGLVVGENHEDVSSKRFLIDNMARLREAGVDHLFLEHVLSDTHQAELDQYHDSDADQPLPAALAAYLKSLDEGHMNAVFLNQGPGGASNTGSAVSALTGDDFTAVDDNEELTSAYARQKQTYNFTKLVEAAKSQKIRVVAFDTEASYAIHKGGADGNDASALRRYQVMNYLAASKINAVMHPHDDATAPKKWIAFVGNAHANTYREVPGLAELTGTVAVAVDDAEQPDGYLVRTHVTAYPDAALNLNIDVVISMPIMDSHQLASPDLR